MKDETFARSLTATTKSMQELTARLNRGEGTAGKLLTDDALYQRLASLSERLDWDHETPERRRGHRRSTAEGQAVV